MAEGGNILPGPAPDSNAGRVGSDFAHLHLHTQYSLLDGAIRTKDLCKVVKERGMSSVAVTDHGNMFGALQFYQEAKAQGVKPIFGCEVYVSDGDMKTKTERKSYHLVLLARNMTGFKNLQFLVSKGHLDGFYYNPRIDRKLLQEHSEGLIGLSACLGGHISRFVMNGDLDGARQTVNEYRSIFEPGMYFLELQPNGMEAQERVNAALAQLGSDLDVPLVATNDCHYVNKDEAHAHEILMCMGQGRTLDDPKRMKHESEAFYIKRPDEMEPYFRQYPSAMANAARIAQMCSVELSLGKPELPDFKLPDDVKDDLPGYLRKVAHKGLEERFGELARRGMVFDPDMYRQRLDYELDVIVQMKFPGYFLIVWDFIAHAKKIGVPVGPGRGSGAGSLVAYALRITDLDPIQYSLLFERFLNPERVSMPDFDIDFCMDRREEVIQYVTQRYGVERVGQIATFHSLKARGLVRDVCRVMGLQPAEANDIAKQVPEGPKVSLSLAMADPADIKAKIKANPELAGKYQDALIIAESSGRLRASAKDERIGKVLKIGQSLEGLNRHAGMHAAGIVIGNRPLWEHVPCFQADGKIVTQYTMTDVELAGLVKFDFLGLKTLTVLSTANGLIDELRAKDKLEPFDLSAIPMDDKGVYEMISRGDTTGVFQLESSGFKDLLKKLRPDCFGDIVAAVALYRPGPLEGGMVDQFIECKHGRRQIEYPHASLEHVLKETYGVFVYQEQVMQAAQVLAGFSLGSADMMRRAMGKKKKSEMDRQRQLFVEGCATTSQVSAEKANEIFDLIDKFAGYGFNKSHSAAYGLITYQTAYLKHHFPASFMAALMTCDKANNDNVVKFIAEARSMGMTVLSPDVNESGRDFSVVRRTTPDGHVEEIRFGMAGVRGVGENAVDAILAARKVDGNFKSLFELCRRVDLKKVNKRTIEGLICAGAFDSVADGRDRAVLLGAIESAVEQGQGASRDRNSGQFGLFDMLATSTPVYDETYPRLEAWAPKTKLVREREAIGFYLTGHPLDRYQNDIDSGGARRTGQLTREHHGENVTLAGVICDLREVMTKSGKGAMGFFQLEDQFGRVESVIFPKTYAKVDESTGLSFNERLRAIGDDPIFVMGKLEVDLGDDGEPSKFKLLVEDLKPIAQIREERTQKVVLKISLEMLTNERILRLKQIVADHGGPCTLEMRVTSERYGADLVFGDKFHVRADDDLMHSLERLFGEKVAHLVE